MAVGYNIAPCAQVLTVVATREGQLAGGLMQWGLPYPKGRLINARIETLSERSRFRPLLEHGRCLVPMNGYFEWHTQTRQPYYITSVSGQPLWALGLYQKTDQGPRLVIVTQSATPQLAAIHPRMPALVAADQLQDWLNRSSARYRKLLSPDARPRPRYLVYPVSPKVNRASFNDPEVIAPKAPLHPEFG
jgi:putative SOS response-associated peptidase YedK